ncbi:hypothetical protein LTR85_001802 [Meristemomyces frigidus]|nr:hypothetical protein LTR85_001802 [Meristemomyces frigidus]
MDHGRFLVQMPGECIAVPANSPYAVVALNSCYIYGHTFTLQTEAIDPSSVLAEKGGNSSATEACEKRVDQLERGLRSKIFRQAYSDHFFETWAIDALVFRESHSEHSFQRLVQLWADDIRDRGSCEWCSSVGWSYLGLESVGHARAHLAGKDLDSYRASRDAEREAASGSEWESGGTRGRQADNGQRTSRKRGKDVPKSGKRIRPKK